MIVAQAGRKGAVTVATNMAGRGVDILLGGNPEYLARQEMAARGFDNDRYLLFEMDEQERAVYEAEYEPIYRKFRQQTDAEHEEVVALGGLYVLGTERHESRRIDRQLRGRSGRQGDPGASVFFISLEDDLMRLFRSDRIAGVMDRLGVKEGEVITHPLVTKSIARSQRRVEAHNFEIRKRLIEYDDVMNRQREVIYGRRNEVIDAGDLHPILEAMIDDHVESALERFIDPSELPENQRRAEFLAQLEATFLYSFAAPDDMPPSVEALREHVTSRAHEALRMREDYLGREFNRPELVPEFEKFILLQVIDEKWMDHLHELDSLKEGIHLRAYAQKDPLIEYKREAFSLFSDLNERIDRDALYAMFHARLAAAPRPAADLSRARAEHRAAAPVTRSAPAGPAETPPPALPVDDPRRSEPRPFGTTGRGATEATSAVLRDQPARGTVVRTEKKVGRNDPCPCGSGKKYKNCCGAST
jgi:preprotein translocase subunit SecA